MASPNPELDALVDIYHLAPSGRETPRSLTAINWRPADNAFLLGANPTEHENWFSLLALSLDGEPATREGTLALGQVTDTGSRRAAIGANPVHDVIRPLLTGGRANARAEAWFEQLIGWLVERDMPFAPAGAPELNVVMSHVAGVDSERRDTLLPRWLEARGQHVRLAADPDCDAAGLLACMQDADILVLGAGYRESGGSDAAAAVTAALQLADARGIPVLYLHDGLTDSQHASAALESLGLRARAGTGGLQVVHAGGSRLVRKLPSTVALGAALP